MFEKKLGELDIFYFLLTSFLLAIFISIGVLFLIPNNLTDMPFLISGIVFIEVIIIGFTIYLLLEKRVPLKTKYKVGIALGAELLIVFLLLLPFEPQTWISKGNPLIAAEYMSFISAFLGATFSFEKIVYTKNKKIAFLTMFIFFVLMLVNLLLLNSIYF